MAALSVISVNPHETTTSQKNLTDVKSFPYEVVQNCWQYPKTSACCWPLISLRVVQVCCTCSCSVLTKCKLFGRFSSYSETYVKLLTLNTFKVLFKNTSSSLCKLKSEHIQEANTLTVVWPAFCSSLLFRLDFIEEASWMKDEMFSSLIIIQF